MLRKTPLILFLSLIFYQAQAQWTFYSVAESFEEKSGTTTDSNGNIVDIYGDIWIEPTTDASISSIADGKSANYVYSGDKSMKLDGPAGSTNTTSTTLIASTENNSFSVELSTDGGLTYETIQTFEQNTLGVDFFKTSTAIFTSQTSLTEIRDFTNVCKVRIKSHFNDDVNFSLYIEELRLESRNGDIKVNLLEPDDNESSLTETL